MDRMIHKDKREKWFSDDRPLQHVTTYELIKELELRVYGTHIADSDNKIEYREKQQ